MSYFPMKPRCDTIQNVTTGSSCVLAPNPVSANTFAVQLSATVSAWVSFVGPASLPIASASQTVATPGVFTTATQGFTAGTPVYLTGTAPGGFSLNTVYYVIATGLTTTACQLSATVGGTGKQCTASHACVIHPLGKVSATTGILVKATDPVAQYAIAPGTFIATLQVAATGTVNIVELTH